jgi:hypothetical protein
MAKWSILINVEANNLEEINSMLIVNNKLSVWMNQIEGILKIEEETP